MNREEAYQLLNKYLTNQNLLKHSLAAEEAMKAICLRLNPSADPSLVERWGITGLLHDADYEMAKNQPEKHGLLLFEKETNTIPSDISYAIKAHNFPNTGILPQSLMDWAIVACDQLTGLIVAAALVHPEKKLSAITTDFILNRFNEKSFARGADRRTIMYCEEKLNLPLAEFVEITLRAMQKISNELGL